MSLILFEQQGPIGRLTLNNPENLNAMTHAMGEAIQKIIPEINARQDLRVVILSGAGRAFSAGGDFKFILDHRDKAPEENKNEMIEFYGKFLSLRDIQVPTIAMINGPAIGAGFLISLACDLRYADAGAKMGANFAKIGLSSGMGGLYWLTQLAGSAVAADLLFTGRTFEASEGLKLGLVNQVFAKEDLENSVLKIAEEIAANAPMALKIMKQGLQKAVNKSLKEVLEYESEGQAQCFPSQDLAEGIAAVKEKRRANFVGK